MGAARPRAWQVFGRSAIVSKWLVAHLVTSWGLDTFIECLLHVYLRWKADFQGTMKGASPDGAGSADERWLGEGPADPWGSSGRKERESPAEGLGVFLRYVDV